MPAPVIVDEQSGEPLVFYPASIPVELKLPPLLSKKNQLKVLKARAAAQRTDQRHLLSQLLLFGLLIPRLFLKTCKSYDEVLVARRRLTSIEDNPWVQVAF